MNLLRRTFTRRARIAASHEISPEDVFLDSENVSNLNLNQLEGHLERPLGRHIFYLVLVIVFVVVGGMLTRLFLMQIVHGAEYAEKADHNHLKSTPIFALRGTISDRNHALLAWNTTATSTKSTTTEEVPEREYTTTPGFSHVLGYVSYPKKDASGVFWQEEYIGKDGIEKEYQDMLQGVPGERVIAINALHQVEAENVIVSPSHGTNITLTIDKDVQAKLYDSIANLAHTSGFVAGSGVIMNVHTGAILAIVSYPEYNNNAITNAVTSADKKKVTADFADPRHLFLNRAVSGLFTPGSTVKPFMAIAALTEGIISPDKSLYSSGSLVIKNKYGGPDSIFRDWKAHGWVTMRDALAVSSDEYFYQVGGGYQDQPGLGIARIDHYARLFGFASTTGIDLPGEESGTIPTPEWKKKIFGEDWLLGDTYHTAIGQYGFQLTPLELVRGDAAIANGGYLVTPHILSNVETTSLSLGLKDSNLRVVREGMRQGVVSGITNSLNLSGIAVAAKSGTAQLGYKNEHINSWISGFFPYDHPEYAFAIVMEKGSATNLHGAVFAARDTIEWMRDNTNYTK